MATYSAFFSSGLLAPHPARCTTPVLPASPMSVSLSPVDPVERQLSVTPTPPAHSPCPTAPEARGHAGRPRVRRRRSSINIGASPMALIKSPVRNAGSALQRTGIMSPSRNRAASVIMNEASGCNSLLGRLRSGSVIGVANPLRRMRRAVRAPTPLVPPPNAPLPALPSSPTPKCGSLLPPAILSPMLPPCTDDTETTYPPTSQSTALLGPDDIPKMPIKSPSLRDSCDHAIDVTMED